MGWLFEWHDCGRAEYLKRITNRDHFATGYTPIAHRVIGSHVWQAVRHEATGEVFIHLDLIAKQRNGGWGYKGMSEEAGPYCYDCPLSLLAMCTEPKHEYARDWREKVRKYHAEKKATPKPAPGLTVTVNDRRYELIEKLAPRRGWKVRDIDYGGLYRMTGKQLNRALAQTKEVA